MGGKPTYDLQLIQQLVGQGPLSRWITKAAAQGGALLGLGDEDVIEAVLLLTVHDFYKTMEAEMVPGLWQDVYHLGFRGRQLYIKIQIGDDRRAVVVQFKQR